jgi:hypothetical protein
MNFYEIEFIAKERQNRIAEEFYNIHLLNKLGADKSSFREKWTLRLADFLINWGSTLKAHYRTACCNQNSCSC